MKEKWLAMSFTTLLWFKTKKDTNDWSCPPLFFSSSTFKKNPQKFKINFQAIDHIHLLSTEIYHIIINLSLYLLSLLNYEFPDGSESVICIFVSPAPNKCVVSIRCSTNVYWINWTNKLIWKQASIIQILIKALSASTRKVRTLFPESF